MSAVLPRPSEIPIDSNGNLASKTEGTDTWTYTWNAENQLTKVAKNSVEQARFAYDPLNRRLEKVGGGVTAAFTYAGADILREIRGETTVSYVNGPGLDEVLMVDDGAGQSFFHADGLGSVVKVTNAAGTVTLARQYDAWGNLEIGASNAGYAFTGREWDPETGLYYYRARYYDSKLGRFLSEDPLGFRDGVNVFTYVRNSPARYTDPLGLAAANPPGCRGGNKCNGNEQEKADALCKNMQADPKAPDCLKRGCPARVRCNNDTETCDHYEPGNPRPIAHGAATHGAADVHLCRGENSCRAILHELLHECYKTEDATRNAEQIFVPRYCRGL